MKKYFVHRFGFRVLIALLTGMLAYILILLTFNTIKNLFVNILSFEAMLCVLIAGLNSETTRIWILMFHKPLLMAKKPAKLITAQILVSLVFSALITSSVVYLYYVYLVGFNRFGTELMVFNSIFLVFVVLLHTTYFSIFFLNSSTNLKLKQADRLKDLAESELEAYKLKVDPHLLNTCLETLIALIRTKPAEAAEYVQKLSDVYRVLLTIKPLQVCSLKNEIESAENFCYLYNQKYGDIVSLFVPAEYPEQTGVLQSGIFGMVHYLVNSSIISTHYHLNIHLLIEGQNIVIRSSYNPKLIQCREQQNMLEYLKRNHFQLTGHEIEIYQTTEQISFTLKTVCLI